MTLRNSPVAGRAANRSFIKLLWLLDAAFLCFWAPTASIRLLRYAAERNAKVKKGETTTESGTRCFAARILRK